MLDLERSEARNVSADLKRHAVEFNRSLLRRLYSETLRDYREPTSAWMAQFSRKTLQNIWDSYKETRQ